jgi:hypothetical protein
MCAADTRSSLLSLYGSEAVALLLRCWPATHLPGQVATLIKLIFASANGQEKLVGSMCVAWFSRANTELLDELAQLLSQKLLALLECDWGTLAIPNTPTHAHPLIKSAVACAWIYVASCKGRVVGDWAPAADALIRGLEVEREPALQRFAAEALAYLLRVHGSLEPVVMQRVCRLVVNDRKLTPLVGAAAEQQRQQLRQSQHLEGVEVYPVDDEDSPAVHGSRGALCVFGALGLEFGPALLSLEDAWWQPVLQALAGANSQQELVDALRVVHTAICAARRTSEERTLALLSLLVGHLSRASSVEAQTVLAESVAAAAEQFPVPSLRLLCLGVLARDDVPDTTALVTVLACVHRVLATIQAAACPFLAFMVLPVLGAMSNRDENVRRAAARAFAQLVGLMALEAGVPDPPVCLCLCAASPL